MTIIAIKKRLGLQRIISEGVRMSIVTQQVNFKELSFLALFSLIFGSMMGSGVFDIPQNVSHQAGAFR